MFNRKIHSAKFFISCNVYNALFDFQWFVASTKNLLKFVDFVIFFSSTILILIQCKYRVKPIQIVFIVYVYGFECFIFYFFSFSNLFSCYYLFLSIIYININIKENCWGEIFFFCVCLFCKAHLLIYYYFQQQHK